MYKLALSMISLLACAASATAQIPNVVTDIAPVQSLVAKVMDGLGEPLVLLDAQADPHHVQLRPSQARSLARADVVIWMGPTLTPWLEQGLMQLASGAAILTLTGSQNTAPRRFPDGQIDPHGWLDPNNAGVWIDTIADTLSQADPENQGRYRDNAARAILEIEATARKAAGILAAVGAADFVFSHDGFGYFTARFNLKSGTALTSGDAAKPGAAHLSDIRALLLGGGVACAFYETGASATLLQNLTRGTDVPVASLDILGRNIPRGPLLYDALIIGLAGAISNCVAGPQPPTAP